MFGSGSNVAISHVVVGPAESSALQDIFTPVCNRLALTLTEGVSGDVLGLYMRDACSSASHYCQSIDRDD